MRPISNPTPLALDERRPVVVNRRVERTEVVQCGADVEDDAPDE